MDFRRGTPSISLTENSSDLLVNHLGFSLKRGELTNTPSVSLPERGRIVMKNINTT